MLNSECIGLFLLYTLSVAQGIHVQNPVCELKDLPFIFPFEWENYISEGQTDTV